MFSKPRELTLALTLTSLPGVIVLDGKGGISSGEQTVNFVDPFTGTLVTTSDTNLTGNYFLGSDGRGTITINPNNDTDIGTEAFSFVFLSSSQALIAALPTNTLTISATGTMDLQTSTARAFWRLCFRGERRCRLQKCFRWLWAAFLTLIRPIRFRETAA